MQHQRVPVRVLEDSHVADAAVHCFAEELDPVRLELRARLVDVIDVERDRVRVGYELLAKGLGPQDLRREGAAQQGFCCPFGR